MLNIDLIKQAEKRLHGKIVETPLLNSQFLDDLAGKKILIKAECLQITGSFKYRGALSAISALSSEKRKKGVVAYSSGNHAQGVAAAAGLFGIPAIIVMPEDAPAIKIKNTVGLGAEIIFYNRVTELREEIGEKVAKDRGLTLVKPYDDPLVIAGQGTCGLEIARQTKALGIDKAEVLVCCGGGGLSAGISLALHSTSPNLLVRTCEPEGYDDMARSLLSGKRESNVGLMSSICDAILTPTPGELTFPLLKKMAGPGLVVSDTEVLSAMANLFMRLKLVSEPGGAVALAAALFHQKELVGDTIIVLVSGGNVDPMHFISALENYKI